MSIVLIFIILINLIILICLLFIYCIYLLSYSVDFILKKREKCGVSIVTGEAGPSLGQFLVFSSDPLMKHLQKYINSR